MFTVHCDDLGEVLLTAKDVLGVRNTDRGVLVAYRCWCGRNGVLLTGSGADREISHHVDSVAA